MPVIEESGSFRSPDLDGDADSYSAQDRGEFGTIPAEEGLLDDMRDGFSVIAGVIGDGNIATDGTDLLYRLTDHSHIPMVDCNAISHLFFYIIIYKTHIYTKYEWIIHLK